MKQTTTNNDDEKRYAQFGLAALIPGIQHAVDTLQEMLDSARAQLAVYQGVTAAAPVKPARQLHRGWPADPEARSAEMMRRRKVAEAKRQGVTLRGKPLKLHPRDSKHPKHAEWVAMIQRALKKGQRKKAREAKLLPKVAMDKGVAA